MKKNNNNNNNNDDDNNNCNDINDIQININNKRSTKSDHF